MNNTKIKCFLEIVNEKSFTKAANKLYITQPAISRYVTSLEKEFGVILFDRSNKHVELTEAGRIYYDLFRKFDVEFQNAEKKVNEAKAKRKGVIKMGYMAGWSLSSFLPEILKKFSEKYPEVTVTLESLDLGELIQALSVKKLDVILVIDDCLNSISDINRQKVAEIQVLLLYHKSHALASKENLNLGDFKDEPFFILANEEVHRREFEVRNFCRPFGFVPYLKQVNGIEAVISAVENGLGVTFFDEWGRNINTPSFRYIPINAKHNISMAWDKVGNGDTIQEFVNEFTLHLEKSEKNR